MSAGQVLIDIAAVVVTLLAVVLVHEGGHFSVAKLSGIRVDEFAVGFGPKVFSRKRGETLYSLRAIPAGGFVRMPGMLGLAGEADAGERNFYRASKPRRFATLAAGIVFNFVFAGICFTAVNMAPTPSHVVPGGPLAAAGLRDGATITAIDGVAIRHDTPQDVTTDLHAATTRSQGRPLHITYQASDGSVHMASVQPALALFYDAQSTALQPGLYVITAIDGHAVGTGDPAALLGNGGSVTVSGYPEGSPNQPFSDARVTGVSTGYGAAPNSVAADWLIGLQAGFDGEPFPAAISNGFQAIPDFIRGEAVGIYQLITIPSLGGVTGPNGFTGPVGIAQATVSAAQGGILGQQGLIWWIGFVSMSLGLINVLPIPFLDGGKLLFLGIEAVRRRRIDPRFEAAASAVGLAVIVLFAIYVTIGDVGRLM